jgi:type IV pilus assembly protein PilW
MKSSLMSSREQTGFGLIELMIAMTLGLVLLGGIGYVFLGSRGAFRTTDNLSRIQENARYALEVMSRDIRMAGYIGCGNIASMTVTNIASSPVPPLNISNALIGYASGSGWTNPTSITRVTGPDVISVMGALGSGVNLTGNVGPSNANAQVNGNPDGYKQDDVLVLTNCSSADVFKVTNSPGNSGMVTLAYGSGSNSSNRVTGTYALDAFVLRVDQHSYFIGTNPAGNPALYRVGLDALPEELVENVQDMQIRYGLDTNGDGTADSYSTTPANWTQVVSVTVSLLMRSPDNNISTATQSLTFDNGTFSAPDRRLYQVFSSTVGVRNRLPAL